MCCTRKGSIWRWGILTLLSTSPLTTFTPHPPTHPRIYSCLQTQAEIVIEELIEHGRCSIERVIARATDWVIQMRGASCTGNSSEGDERVRGWNKKSWERGERSGLSRVVLTYIRGASTDSSPSEVRPTHITPLSNPSWSPYPCNPYQCQVIVCPSFVLPLFSVSSSHLRAYSRIGNGRTNSQLIPLGEREQPLQQHRPPTNQHPSSNPILLLLLSPTSPFYLPFPLFPPQLLVAVLIPNSTPMVPLVLVQLNPQKVVERYTFINKLSIILLHL